VKLVPMDPVKVKEQIVDLKAKLADDVKRVKKGNIPGWLRTRKDKREQQLRKLEDMVA